MRSRIGNTPRDNSRGAEHRSAAASQEPAGREIPPGRQARRRRESPGRGVGSQTDRRASPLQPGRDPVRRSRRADGPDISPLWPALARRRRYAAVRPPSHPRESQRPSRFATPICAPSSSDGPTDLAEAEATLAKVDSADVKLPLHFGLIRLDLNGDGKAEPDERLFNLYAELNAAARNQVTARSRQGIS